MEVVLLPNTQPTDAGTDEQNFGAVPSMIPQEVIQEFEGTRPRHPGKAGHMKVTS